MSPTPPKRKIQKGSALAQTYIVSEVSLLFWVSAPSKTKAISTMIFEEFWKMLQNDLAPQFAVDLEFVVDFDVDSTNLP